MHLLPLPLLLLLPRAAEAGCDFPSSHTHVRARMRHPRIHVMIIVVKGAWIVCV
jgi:hypothetical protein